MSIRTAVNSGINNGQRDLPFEPQPNPEPSTGTWTRPADWPALPSMTTTDSTFIGLLAVTNDNSNYVAFTFITTTGTYNVDWGDGTSSLGVTSNTVAQHQYDYSTLGTSVTSRGYKTATVVVTPNTGGAGFTAMNLQTKYVLTATLGTLNIYTSKWLDISLGSPNLTSCTIGTATLITGMTMLEQVRLYSTSTASSSIANNMFYNCIALQSVPVFNLSSNYNSLISTFRNCISLKNPPILPSTTDTFGVTCTDMFRDCSNLEIVPDSVFANLENKVGATSSMFQSCPALIQPPMLSWPNGSFSMNNMFQFCSSLKYVPNYNFKYISNLSNTFASCVNLVYIPNIIAPLCTTISAMCQGCASLATVPILSLPSCTIADTVFSGCRSIRTVPALNLPAVTNMSSMFIGCFNLISVGTITTGTALTNLSSMFDTCAALVNAPTITNTTNVTTTNAMFSGCRSLKSIPLYNTANVTDMSSMFATCSSLRNIPTFNTIKLTTASTMFSACSSLESIPAFNTGNLVTMTSMFATCASLSNVAFTDVTKAQQMVSVFNGCTTLTSQELLTGGVNSWNTSNVLNMNTMFQNCYLIETIPTFNTIKVTSVNNMFSGANTLTTVPALNFSNSTSSQMFASNPTLSNVQITGIKTNTTFASAQMSKTALESVFLNSIIANTTSQNIVVTSNPGTDTPVVRTSGTANSLSNSVPFSNTVGITAGMIAYATGYTPGSRTLTINVGTANISGSGANLAPPVNNKVGFLNPTSITNITANTVYYVVNSNADGNFQVSNTLGGSAITFTGTTSSVAIKIPLYVQSVVANTSVILSTSPYTTTATSVSFRRLDMGAAFIKNWTVTG